MPTAPRLLTRTWTLASVLLLMLGLMPLSAGTLSAQDARTSALDEPIWSLIPGNASGLIAVNTDSSSEQWQIAAELLETAGLTQVVTSLFDQIVAESDLSPANVDPVQSSILGGTIAVAGWGDGTNPFAHSALYVDAIDPVAAYRSITAQLLTETDPNAIDVEIPGGRLATDSSGSIAILLLNGVVVISEADDAQGIAGLVTGAGPTLADFEPFTRVMEAQSGDQLIRAYANGPAATQTSLGGFSPYPGYGLGYQELLLFAALAAPVTGTYTSVGISATDGGFLLRAAQLPVPIIGPELPKGSPSEDLDSEVSRAADLFISGRGLGQNTRFAQLIDMVVISAATESGAHPDQPTIDIRSWAYDEIERRTGIDLHADLLDQINGDYVMAGALESVDRLSDVNLVVRSDLGDAGTVADTIGKLATLLRVATSDLADEANQAELTEAKIGDDTLYTLTVRDGGQAITFSFGVIDNQLLATMGDGMSLLTDGGSASLADDPGYRDAIAKLPEQDGAPFYLDLHKLITLAGLTFVDAPADWGLPAGQQISLGAFQSVAGTSYAKGSLARTDLFLSLSGNVPGPSGTPSSEGSWAPYPGLSNIAIADATAIDVGKRRVLSIAPDGSRAVVRANDGAICVVPLDESGEEHCTDRIQNVEAENIVWSPDSALVAMSENAPWEVIDSDIWTIDAVTGEVRDLTDDGYAGPLLLNSDRPDVPDSIPVDGGPVFTPDSAGIVFSRTDYSETGLDTDLYRIAVEGGEPEHIGFVSSEPFVAWHGAIWQDDATLLLSYGSASARETNNGLWTVDIESGELMQVWQGRDDQFHAAPVTFLPDGRLVVRFPYNQALFSIFMESCPYAVLDLASGDSQPIRDGNGYCASVVGISPAGGTALVSAALTYGLWFVDLNTLATTEANFDAVTAAVPDRRATSISGAEFQPLVWTRDNEVIAVINRIFPVRVTVEIGT